MSSVSTSELVGRFSRDEVQILCYQNPVQTCTFPFRTVSNNNLGNAQMCEVGGIIAVKLCGCVEETSEQYVIIAKGFLL
jgi:hypothetical protein